MSQLKKIAFWLQGLAFSVALLCVATDTRAAAFDREGALWIVGKHAAGLEEIFPLVVPPGETLNSGPVNFQYLPDNRKSNH